jgi:bifunctional non-homologous end joining protein LigD
MLRQLLAPLLPRLVIVGDFPAQAELAIGARLEGLVAKRLASPYLPGVRSVHWLKIKRPGWQEGRAWRK